MPQGTVLVKKAALKVKKGKTAKKPLLHGKRRSDQKKAASPEAQEAYERAQWQKEKRLYWSSRFRRALADITTKPKPKKTHSF